VLEGLSTEELSRYNWPFWARPEQTWPEGDWRTWLYLAGRGAGKTRCAAEAVRVVACGRSPLGKVRRIALVGETAGDVRDVMVEGPSGVLAVHPERERPRYEPSKRRLTWPNGTVATTYSAEKPDQLRGPEHGFAWCDELAKFTYLQEVWNNLMLGLRTGEDPRCIVTTTPRPLSLLRDLVGRDGEDVVVRRGSTYDNQAHLADAFFEQIVERYEGTRIGRQEIEAHLLEEAPGALFSRDGLEAARLEAEADFDLERIVVGLDPTTSADGGGDACGIVVCGRDGWEPALGYVLEDATVRGGPGTWAAEAVRAFDRWGANQIIAEGNQGGALVKEVLQAHGDESLPVRTVHASHGKAARAEPVATLYEKGRVHHVGTHPGLEDELVTWVPGESGASPNRLDAMVWALTHLLVGRGGPVKATTF